MNKKKNIFAATILALAITSMPVTSVSADGMQDANSDGRIRQRISKYEARQIVEHYLRGMGYTRMGQSAFSARTGHTTFNNNAWVWNVSVLAGDRYMVNKRFTVQVDARNGSLLSK